MSYEMNALSTIAGAGRLIKLVNQLPELMPDDATASQWRLLSHLQTEITRQARDERDAAMALMEEVSA